jgi:hypothetical protein
MMSEEKLDIKIDKDKLYKVYLLNMTPKGEFITPVEKQLAAIREHFKSIYGVEPEHLFLGPIIQGLQVMIPHGYVWIPVPEAQASSPPKGYHYMTGYDSDHPELKTI